MTAHKKAWGNSNFLPKHHWLFDIPLQISRDGGVLLDMFITERLHLTCKSIAEKIKNTTSFEASVLQMRSWSQKQRAGKRAQFRPMSLLGATAQE